MRTPMIAFVIVVALATASLLGNRERVERQASRSIATAYYAGDIAGVADQARTKLQQPTASGYTPGTDIDARALSSAGVHAPLVYVRWQSDRSIVVGLKPGSHVKQSTAGEVYSALAEGSSARYLAAIEDGELRLYSNGLAVHADPETLASLAPGVPILYASPIPVPVTVMDVKEIGWGECPEGMSGRSYMWRHVKKHSDGRPDEPTDWASVPSECVVIREVWESRREPCPGGSTVHGDIVYRRQGQQTGSAEPVWGEWQEWMRVCGEAVPPVTVPTVTIETGADFYVDECAATAAAVCPGQIFRSTGRQAWRSVNGQAVRSPVAWSAWAPAAGCGAAAPALDPSIIIATSNKPRPAQCGIVCQPGDTGCGPAACPVSAAAAAADLTARQPWVSMTSVPGVTQIVGTPILSTFQMAQWAPDVVAGYSQAMPVDGKTYAWVSEQTHYSNYGARAIRFDPGSADNYRLAPVAAFRAAAWTGWVYDSPSCMWYAVSIIASADFTGEAAAGAASGAGGGNGGGNAGEDKRPPGRPRS